ncbi:uncharacterized protein C15orf39 homolog isoform X2 [Vanacampus margaritifer]
MSNQWKQTLEMTAESLSRARPTQMEPNFSGYPCMPPLSMLTSLSEQSRHLQPPPRGYAGLHPSHATYEHMTSELYQECSPMPKYGHPTKHPMFYYPQANMEVENRTHCWDIGGERKEDIPVIRKSTVPTPREHYAFPQTLHGEIPLFLHSTETQPSHSFVQGFGYPCYAHPGFHLSQIRNVESPHAPPGLPSHRISVSPSDQRFAMAASLQERNQHIGPLDPSHPLLRMEAVSPTRPLGQSVLPSHIPMRLYHLLTSRLDHQMDQAVLSPSGLTQDRLLDYSSYASRFTCPKHPNELPVSPRTRIPQSKADCVRSETVITTANKHNRLSCNSILKDSLKRRFPSLIKIKEEAPDLCELDWIKKQQKLETDGVLVRNQASSPPMPVIDAVFSLAPDQRYLKSPDVEPRSRTQQSDYCQVKPTTPLREIKSDPVGPPTYTCPEISQVQMMQPAKIKVEKINQSDACGARGNSPSPAACGAIQHQIKPQAEDATLSDAKSMLVTQICEPDTLECKPASPEVVNAGSQSPELPVNATTPQEQVASTAESKPVSPLEPKLDDKSILPERLKLNSTNNLRHPALNPYCPAAQQETPAHIPAEIPPMKAKPSVRKHFFELHYTLCDQVSKCVSGTSEQQLRTWRSQLELAEPSSTKVQKVSCLLGSKARHKWLNKEISSALQDVLDRFREYIIHERCPFPQVKRTGAVFLPMLVVKKKLFPVVPESFIDQVLQEHKVKLRPTTLSEERILILLHKPCSSRLRRLISLKHLPDVYADALNLLYYSYVCKHLGVDVETLEGPNINSSSSPEPTFHQRSATKSKSRVKISSRRTFLNDSWSDDEDGNSQKHTEKDSHKKTSTEDDSWTHPLTSKDFPSSSSDDDEAAAFRPANSSGMMIKLKEAERSRVTFKWQRTGNSGRTLRPLNGYRKQKTTSRLKIKYCHSAKRRRRSVLRSAVRRARGAFRLDYPDLVGKKIRHLYEEDDKSEVWYRGEVVRVHEAHSDPLKTIFEVRYDSEPDWKYYLELLIDYKKGWLTIEDT